MKPMLRPRWLAPLAAGVALLGGQATLLAQEPTPEAAPLPPPPPSLARAAAEEARLDYLAARDTYQALLEEAILSLGEARQPSDPEREPDPRQARALLAEIEWLLFHFEEVSHIMGDRVEAADRLQRLGLSPATDGMAWARVAAWQSDARTRLANLTNWQIIGPFDNERGAAFQAPLPPESAPGAALTHQGAEREVQWRALPQPLPADGILDFGRLLRPARQRALLARTWVHSEARTEAYLLLGIAGEVRVWHEGRPVFEVQGRHDLHRDSQVAALTLTPGWNEITLKLGSRDHNPRLVARLVEADSLAPLALVTSAAVPEGRSERILAAGKAPGQMEIQPGARGYYHAMAMFTPEDVESRLRLGELEASYEVAPKSENPGRAMLREAAELAPTHLPAALALAIEMFPGTNANPAEIDLNPWLEQADRAEGIGGAHGLIQTHRILALARFQGMHEAAYRRADTLVEDSDGAIVAVLLRGMVAEMMDEDALGARNRLALLEHEQIDAYPRQLAAGANALAPGDPERLRLWKRAYARTDWLPTLRAIVRAEQLARPSQDTESLQDDLARLSARDPWNAPLLRDYARRFQSRGELELAFALCERAIRIRPDAPDGHGLLARLHLAAGDLEAAVDALEAELVRDFGNSDEQRLLDYLRSQDDSSFEQKHREALAAVIERHPATEETDGAAYEYLLVRHVVRVHPDGTADRYRRQVIRVLEPSAARSLDRRLLPFMWGEQDLRLLTARVLHPDGRESTAATDRGSSARVVDLPELAVGDVIDLEWRVDDLRPGLFGTYFGLDQALVPETDVPVRESQVVVIESPELPLRFHGMNLDGVEHAVADAGDFGTSHSWTMRDLAPWRPEPSMPPAEELAPRVQASSYASWEDFGAWWWQLIEPGITLSPEMRAEVARLTADLPDRQAKVDAIYDFVANDIRYNAWEFGIHGYQPYSAPVIFSRRFGDCKDKSILLRAMLSEIDVEAWPVLIRRVADQRHRGLRYREDLTLPLVSDFNHCIAWIPAQEGVEEAYVDGTARLHPRSVLPYDNRGAEILVVREDGVTRTRIPFDPAEVNRTATGVSLELAADGSAMVELELSGFGRFDPELRRIFSGTPEEREQVAEGLLGAFFGPVDEGVTLEITDVEDMDQPVVVRLAGRAHSFASRTADGLELPTTLSPQNMLSSGGMAGLKERTHDLLIEAASTDSQQWMVLLPPGWSLAASAPTVEASADGLADYRWSLDPFSGGFFIAEELRFHVTRVAAADYPRLREFARTVDRNQGATLTLVPPPPQDELQPVDSSSPPGAGRPSGTDGREDNR
jgi:tetratricopeptide (TPR) repeat protein